MPFAYVLDNLTNTERATKLNSWRGYIYKSVIDEENNTYTLTFVQANGTTYNFTYSGGKFSTSGSMYLDGELLSAMASQDWIVGNKTDFESVRTGSEGKVW